MKQQERKSEDGIMSLCAMVPTHRFGKHHKFTSRSETPPSHSHPQQDTHTHILYIHVHACTHTHVHCKHISDPYSSFIFY